MLLKLEGRAKCHFNGKTYQRGAVIMEFLPGAIKFLKREGWVEYIPDPEPISEPESDEVEFPRPERPLRPTMRDPLESEPEPSPLRRRGRQRSR